ncbi:hypothetical protein C8R46DRAFT_1225517 [Mycena filopes]|nr:hypothetical protein C8R46DRAFT_1225517 [Mycena filopes]
MSANMDLSKLPTDILFELLKVLTLPDAVSLLLTCTDMSHTPGFWISVLETMRKTSTLACPPHAELSQCNLETLRGLATLWLRLRKNWNQPSPKIIGSGVVTSVPTYTRPETDSEGTVTQIMAGGARPPTEFILAVPGTDILLLRVPKSEVTGTSDISTTGWQTHRHVATVTHEAGKAVGFTTSVSEVVEKQHIRGFLTETVVGTVGVANTESELKITKLRGATDANVDTITKIKLPAPFDAGKQSSVFTFKGHLYHLMEEDHSLQIRHISREQLNLRSETGFIEPSNLYSLSVPALKGQARSLYIPTTPLYGIGAVLVQWEWDGEIDIIFIPTTATNATDDGISSPLVFDANCVTQSVPGVPGPTRLDHSGCNLVLLVTFNLVHELVLVRYHPDTKKTSVHKLEAPDSALKDLFWGELYLDDSAGVIYILNKRGGIWTLRYV